MRRRHCSARPAAAAAERSLASLSGELHGADTAFAMMAIEGNRHALESRLDALHGDAGGGAWGRGPERAACGVAFRCGCQRLDAGPGSPRRRLDVRRAPSAKPMARRGMQLRQRPRAQPPGRSAAVWALEPRRRLPARPRGPGSHGALDAARHLARRARASTSTPTTRIATRRSACRPVVASTTARGTLTPYAGAAGAAAGSRRLRRARRGRLRAEQRPVRRWPATQAMLGRACRPGLAASAPPG